MAKKISSLSVILGGTAQPFADAVASAGKTLDGFKDKIGGFGSTLLKFTGIGAAIGAVIGGIGFGALFHSQSEAIDSTAKLADRLGITTDSLAAMQHAAGLSGVATDELTGGLEKYLKNASDAAGGSKEAAAAFSALGLDAKDLINQPTDVAIGKIGDALNAIQNPAQRAAAAQTIFGKSGQSLLPFLAEGSDGLGQMRQEAEALGLTFNRVDAAKVEEANDGISRVGEVAMGVMRQVVIAAAPFISQITAVMTSLGERIVSGVKVVLPVLANLTTGLFNILTGVWTSIYNTVAPIVSAIVSWITDNWQSIVAVVASRLAALWSVISGAFTGIWTLVTTIGGMVASAWEWAMETLGIQSDNASTATGKSFQTIGDWLLWLEEGFNTALVTIGYALANWKSIVELVGIGVILSFVTIGNQIEYVFTVVVPAVLKWFGDNWKQILTDVFNMTTTIFGNLASNIVGILKNLPGLISGSVSFGDLWTPLTDGFKVTLSQLPDIAARQTGPLEQALQDQQDQLQQQLGSGLDDALAKNKKAGKDAADALANAMKPGTGPANDLKPPTIPPPTLDIDTDPAKDKLKGVSDAAKSTTADIKNIATDSAEQMQRMALAMAAPIVTPADSATPVSPDIRAAMQEGPQRAADAAGQASSMGAIASLVGKLYTLLKDNKTQLTEVASA